MKTPTLSTRHVRILLVLADAPRHGYEIGKEIEHETGGRIRLRPGSLYRALHQLLERGLIRELEEDEGDPRRRSYDVTSSGRQALSAELTRMGQLVEQGRRLGVVGTDRTA